MEGHEGALGIVACHLLEDELVHVLSKDPLIRTVHIVEAHISTTLEGKLRRKVPHALLHSVPMDEIDVLQAGPDSVIIWQKPIVLHLNPHELKDEVFATLHRLQPHCSALLLFYGLCGNAFLNFPALVKEFQVPVAILTDRSEQVVDDCIGVASGGCNEYLQLLRSNPGTFYLTPMWASNWRQFFQDIRVIEDGDNLDGAKYVFEYMGYRKVLKLNTGLGDSGEFEDKVTEFSQVFHFLQVEQICNTEVVERSYENVRQLMPSPTQS